MRFARGCMWLLLAATICWVNTNSAAQAPGKKVKEEVEEPPKKAPTKTPKPEEEDPVKPTKPPAPLRVDDDEPAAGAKRGKSAAPLLSDLLRDATNEPQEVLDLYRAIETPYDIVTWRQGANTQAFKIQPFPARIANEKSAYAGATPLRRLPEGDQKGIELSFERGAIRMIDPFELWAVGRIKKFAEAHKNSIERLQAAERALQAVLGFHKSAEETARREGPGWEEVANQVRTQLRLVQEAQLQYYSANNDWKQAFAMAAQLAEAHPKRQKEIMEPMKRFVRDLLKEGKDAEAQKRMAALTGIFPNNSLNAEVFNALSKKADELERQAEAKEKENNNPDAIKLIQQALEIAPRHPRLENTLRRLLDDSPVLNVGVSRLPRKFIPGEATTYPELATLDLLYESLVKPVYNKQIGQRYFPVLAADQPKLKPLEREFELVRDAYWSDGEPVRAGDVRFTVERLLRDQRGAGAEDRDDEMQPLKDVHVGDDSFHVAISLFALSVKGPLPMGPEPVWLRC